MAQDDPFAAYRVKAPAQTSSGQTSDDAFAAYRVDSRSPAPTEQESSNSVVPSEWGQAFGRAAFGSLANSVDPRTLESVGHGVIGILKGAGHTAATLGQLVAKIPGVSEVQDALAGVRPGGTAGFAPDVSKALAPQGANEKIGYGGEQAAEFLLPGATAEKTASTIAAKVAPFFANTPRLVRAAARVVPKMAAESAAAAGVAGAQGGNPIVAGAVGATAPLVSEAVGLAAPNLERTALRQADQFLGATKERYKAMAARLSPQLIQRGIRGSRESVLEQAASAAEAAGQKIDDALQGFGPRNLDPTPVADALETAKDAFRTTTPQGKTVVYEPRAVRQLDNIQKTITSLGPTASVKQMVAIRRAWDDVVSQAGGFQHRAGGAIGMPLKDTTEAWAKREGAGAIRQLLDSEVPELTKLNKEYSFWKNLNDVLTQTQQRTSPQSGGLGKGISEVAGAAAGASHGIGPAFAMGKIAKLANSVFTSPRWKLASAQAKDALAHAIMSGDTGQIMSAFSRITAGGTSQATASATR